MTTNLLEERGPVAAANSSRTHRRRSLPNRSHGLVNVTGMPGLRDWERNSLTPLTVFSQSDLEHTAMCLHASVPWHTAFPLLVHLAGSDSPLEMPCVSLGGLDLPRCGQLSPLLHLSLSGLLSLSLTCVVWHLLMTCLSPCWIREPRREKKEVLVSKYYVFSIFKFQNPA